MDNNALATGYEFEFYDGTTCRLTLAFIKLKMLSAKNRSLYERCQKVLSNGAKDEFDTLAVLYAAYVCANMDGDVMSEDEFIEKCGSDRQAVMDALKALTSGKKQKASASRSN